MRLLLLCLLALVPTWASAVPVELSYELEVRIRSFKVDADLLAGARLRMERTETTLVLQQPVEHPWKFYWVAPLVGREEVKYASEATLPVASWVARKKVEADADARGRARWKRWQKEWGGTRAFDQAFTFYVIGSPQGRFVVETMPGGGVSKVENRVTDLWLPTGFADWVGGRSVQGYAFWANEPTPPDWEPHTYDALASALRLLSVPVVRGQVLHPDVAGRARAVLETLVPKTKGQFGGHRDVPVSMTATARGDVTVLEGESAPMTVTGQSNLTLTLYRRTVLDARRRPVSDEVRVRLDGGRSLSLKLSVGWGPSAQ